MEDELYINNKFQGSCFILSRPLLVVDIRDPRMSSTSRTLLAVISGRLPCLGFGFFSNSRLYKASQSVADSFQTWSNKALIQSCMCSFNLVNLSSRQLVILSTCQLVSPSACQLAHLGAFLHYVNKQFIPLEIWSVHTSTIMQRVQDTPWSKTLPLTVWSGVESLLRYCLSDCKVQE